VGWISELRRPGYCRHVVLHLLRLRHPQSRPRRKQRRGESWPHDGPQTGHYLPQYSPGLDPIELAFAKFNALLRKAAERSVRSLWRRIGFLIPKNSTRMRQLFQTRRLCRNLTGFCSS
jgi:transposase